MTGIVLYGIPNCDQVRKARAWLDAHQHAYTFHDVRKQGLEPERIARWVDAVGAATLINRKGTTWRGLDAAVRERVTDDAGAIALMQAHVTVIRRPVIEHGDHTVLVGFDPAVYTSAFARR